MKQNVEVEHIKEIEQHIFTLLGVPVMLGRDLAQLYQVNTKRINEQVKRNALRFPVNYCFRLTPEEQHKLVANCDRFKTLKHSIVLSQAFTEQGAGMKSQ